MTAPLPADQVGRFLTVAETAEVLNVSTAQAYALVRSGDVPRGLHGSLGGWDDDGWLEPVVQRVRRDQ